MRGMSGILCLVSGHGTKGDGHWRGKRFIPLALGVQVTNDHCPCAKVANIIFQTPSALWGESVFLHA
jgi:hypothetical protein